VADHGFISGVIVSLLTLSVADHGFISNSKPVHLELGRSGEQANYYTTDEPMICHTQGEQANYYTTDEPMICHTQGEQANYYTTDEPMI
jgi:hypothetical protein